MIRQSYTTFGLFDLTKHIRTRDGTNTYIHARVYLGLPYTGNQLHKHHACTNAGKDAHPQHARTHTHKHNSIFCFFPVGSYVPAAVNIRSHGCLTRRRYSCRCLAHVYQTIITSLIAVHYTLTCMFRSNL